jgi:hypothetical protein
MMKGLSESGSQRVSIMGSDMLLQPEWSMEEMSKLTSFSHLVNGKLKRRARAAGCCRGDGGEGGGGVRSRRRRAHAAAQHFIKPKIVIQEYSRIILLISSITSLGGPLRGGGESPMNNQ